VLDLRAGTPVAGSALWRHAAYCRRRLGALGQVEAVLAGPEDFEEVFAALVRLHGERWATRGLPGVLAAERDRRFHRDAARSLLQAGCLRLQAIRLDGRIVAVLYGFFAQGRSYYYLSGFASELAGLSLGTQLVAGAVEQAMRDGACEFDFLRGCESYKYRWGAVDRACYVRRIRFASGKPAACNAGTQPPPGMLTG
jgi:CelD/BcsL family acetyltransferase involved in cellulose biosynthesis